MLHAQDSYGEMPMLQCHHWTTQYLNYLGKHVVNWFGVVFKSVGQGLERPRFESPLSREA